MVELSHRAHPAERGSAATAGPARRIAIDGTLAYVAVELAGVVVFDIGGCPCATLSNGSVLPPGDSRQAE